MGKLDTLARQRIEAWRQAAGPMPQKDLAEKIGRNPVWVSRYLDDAYDADLDTLALLASAFNHTLWDLLSQVPTTVEGELVERFRAMSPKERDHLMSLAQILTPDLIWPPPHASMPEASGARVPIKTKTLRRPGTRSK